MTGPISPPPVTEWRPGYLPAYLSNGLVGLRVGHIPLLYGVATVSGFEGLDQETMVEAAARVPYPLAGDVRIGEAALSDPGRAVLREQRYDFSCGELLTRLFFETAQARADIEIVTFCNRHLPSLAMQEVTLTVDRDCEVAMSACADATGVPGNWGHDQPGVMDTQKEWGEGPFSWHSLGNHSRCGLAVASQFTGESVSKCDHVHTRQKLVKTYTFPARRGRTYRLREWASLVPEVMHSQPHMQAARLTIAALRIGFEALREENRREWEWLWKGRVVLVGAPSRWQAIADAAYFYLHTSVHNSSPSSTSVFGLAQCPDYHYYRGHVMWDMDTFVLPPLTLTHPDVALGLLRFRHSRLPAARDNAALSGYRGAQYPWESSLVHGHEAAPKEARGPAAQHHVSMDVAMAFARFVYASNDRHFAYYEAMPVLTAVAEWIESRVRNTSRGYEIQRAIGIAETGVPVDNNAFVNMAAITALRDAIAVAKSLGIPAKRCWKEIAEGLVLPIDHQTKVIHNHDGYDPSLYMAETPGAPAGLFPVGFPIDDETERNTLKYFLRFADQYVGQPMLSTLLGVHAAWLGDRVASLELFEKGYADFVIDPYAITTEFGPTAFPDRVRAGPFTANIGGFLTGCLYGLPGLRLGLGDPTTWFTRPVVLPQGWDAIHVGRVWVHGHPMALHAEHGDRRGGFTEEKETGHTGPIGP